MSSLLTDRDLVDLGDPEVTLKEVDGLQVGKAAILFEVWDSLKDIGLLDFDDAEKHFLSVSMKKKTKYQYLSSQWLLEKISTNYTHICNSAKPWRTAY